MDDLLKYERELYKKGITLIAGVDEVGRGPLYGPVVTAAVILPKEYELVGLTDSKKLSPKKRDVFYEIIKRDAIAISIGMKSAKEIDDLNIYQATKVAMMEAINSLPIKPEHVLIDAMKLEDLKVPSTSIIKGDAQSLSIAAASVIAKVTRDRMMDDIARQYPEYGFDSHKGYPTKMHIDAIKKYGVIEGYRETFEPVKSIINGSEINERSKKRKRAKTETDQIRKKKTAKEKTR